MGEEGSSEDAEKEDDKDDEEEDEGKDEEEEVEAEQESEEGTPMLPGDSSLTSSRNNGRRKTTERRVPKSSSPAITRWGLLSLLKAQGAL